jgi:glucokinase
MTDHAHTPGDPVARKVDIENIKLVGDIGGTNARFALVGTGRPESRRVYKCADYPEVQAAIDSYLAEINLAGRPRNVSLAVAGPVIDGSIAFTNNGWRISERDLVASGFERARLVNDFAALAMVIESISPDELVWLGGGKAVPREATTVVLGPGTGFGVAAMVRDHGLRAIATTEGGHMAFAPGDDEEMEVLRVMRRQFSRVSVERLLSGPGLANLHQALGVVDGRMHEPLEAAEIVRRARAGEESCMRTAKRFCGILGSVAGDFALAYGARGGICIAGGVAEKMADLIAVSDFRMRFDDKGRFTAYVQAIPTWLLNSTDAALIGAALALQL